jgi:hypothetical protein
MHIVYRAENIIDAELVKNALAQEGIPAWVGGAYLTGGVGQLPVSDYVTVQVSDVDIERAQAIAKAVDAALRTPAAESPETDANLPPHPARA